MKILLNNNLPIIGGSFTNEIIISRWEDSEDGDGVYVFIDIPPTNEKLYLSKAIYGVLDSTKIANIVKKYYENNRSFVEDKYFLSDADWDNFNKMMLSDPEFNQILNTVASVSIATASSLPAALTQVSKGQITMFKTIWDTIMNLGQATQSQKDKWGRWAEHNNLPPDFVAIIYGSLM